MAAAITVGLIAPTSIGEDGERVQVSTAETSGRCGGARAAAHARAERDRRLPDEEAALCVATTSKANAFDHVRAIARPQQIVGKPLAHPAPCNAWPNACAVPSWAAKLQPESQKPP
jgi:hypothetical protein